MRLGEKLTRKEAVRYLGAVALAGLATGTMDRDVFGERCPDGRPSDAPEAQQNYEIISVDSLRFKMLAFNLDRPTVIEQAVRQALMYSLDRKALAASQFGDQWQHFVHLADGTQSPLSFAYEPTDYYPYDKDKAQEVLSDAGWLDTDGDTRVDKNGDEAVLKVFARSEQDSQLLDLVEGKWAEIGVQFDRQATEDDHDIWLGSREWFDASGYQGELFTSDGKWNSMHYQNDDYDRLADEALKEGDPDKRNGLLIAASNIIIDEVPVGFLWYEKDVTLISK